MSAEVLARLLAASRFVTPDGLARLIYEHGRGLGATDLTMYLVDYDQRVLVPVPKELDAAVEPLAIEGTMAGRAFRSVSIQRVPLPDGGERVWLPSLDGTDRVGVLEMFFDGHGNPEDEPLLAFSYLVAELILAKDAYGDYFHRLRRQKSMSIAAELTLQLLPPLTFGTDAIVIAAGLFPPYAVGGDAFDYGVDDSSARFALFDAMGHHLQAGLLSSVAMAAYRNCRRRGLEVDETAAVLDDAVHEGFGDHMFVTGVLAQLDLSNGELCYLIAGHPRPLVLRDGHVVKTLEGEPGTPFGVRHEKRSVAREVLEPGDQIVLYTDGVVEARSVDGDFFGVERLVDFIARTSAAGAPPPETMRLLFHSILDHHAGALEDDATAMLVEWRGSGRERMTPQVPTVTSP